MRIPMLAGMAAAVLTAGCLGGGGGAGNPVPMNRELSVTVKNENFYDATIYWCQGVRRERLGVVTGQTARDFEFRWVAPDLRFFIDFTGAGVHVTEALQVDPGDQLELILTPQMFRTTTFNRC